MTGVQLSLPFRFEELQPQEAAPPQKPRGTLPDRTLASEVDLAWLAGLIDGDGCICAYLQRRSDRERAGVRLCVTIVQNDHATLVAASRVVPEGRIYGSKRRVQQNRTVYSLTWNGAKAIRLIDLVHPHLRRKRIEATVAQQLWHQGRLDLHPGPRGTPAEIVALRLRLYEKLRRLK